MKSIINKNERTPSGYIYYNDKLKDYFYKDFSANVHLNAIEFSKLFYGQDKYLNILFENIHELDAIESENKNTERKVKGYIESVYTRITECYGKENIFRYATTDTPYFSDFLKIAEDILTTYRVLRDTRHPHTYYYIDLNGTVVQRYKPYNDKKYKFKNYVRGKYGYGIRHYRPQFRHLLITGSVKDMMSAIMILRNIKIPEYDLIMPVAMLSEKEINVKEDIELKINFFTGYNARFEKVYIGYDNDEHGFKSAESVMKLNKDIKTDNLLMCLCKEHNVKDLTELWIKIRK